MNEILVAGWRISAWAKGGVLEAALLFGFLSLHMKRCVCVCVCGGVVYREDRWLYDSYVSLAVAWELQLHSEGFYLQE